jgi:epoxide hydrolase
MGPEPFTIDVPGEALDDLRARLARTRWPEPLPYLGWAAGADAGYLKDLVAYWAAGFDWRVAERRLNSFAQFTADIGGQRVHFVHERGRARAHSRWCSPTAGRARSLSCSSSRRC